MRRSSWDGCDHFDRGGSGAGGAGRQRDGGAREATARAPRNGSGCSSCPSTEPASRPDAFSNAEGARTPLIALLPDPSKVDYAYWKGVAREQKAAQRTAAVAKRKAATKAVTAAVEPLLVDEAEPDAKSAAATTTPRTRSSSRSSGRGPPSRPAARILGTLAPGATPSTLPTTCPRGQRLDPADGRAGPGREGPRDDDDASSATGRTARPVTAPVTSTSTRCATRRRASGSWPTSTPRPAARLDGPPLR